MVGYGKQDVGDLTYELCNTSPSGLCPAKGLLPGANNRLAAQNVVDAYDATDGLWEADFDAPGIVSTPPFQTLFPATPGFATPAELNSTGSAMTLPLEGMLCGGDSGGGLYVTIGGQTLLAGTNEAIDAPTGGTPTRGYGTDGYWVPPDSPTDIAWLRSVDPTIAVQAPIPEPAGNVRRR